MRLLPILALLLLLCACEERVPLNQAMAVSIADHYQRQQNVNWGEPVNVLPPGGPDAKGRSWWQVRYASGADQARRMILVDHDSGWARFPADDYLERVPPRSRPDAAHPLQVVEGPWVLRLTKAAPQDAQERVKAEREVIRLNTLAGQTGLVPLFSLRQNSAGQGAIIYGWQADRGIAQDAQVLEWVQRRTVYGESAVWENTAP